MSQPQNIQQAVEDVRKREREARASAASVPRANRDRLQVILNPPPVAPVASDEDAPPETPSAA